MSQFSYGKMHQYAKSNEPLPFDGGYDAAGKLSRDAQEIIDTQRPLPIGLWKGAGLAVMLDLFATVLAQGMNSYQLGKQDVEPGVSQFFLCFDSSSFSTDEFVATITNETIEFIKSNADGDVNSEVRYPGEGSLKIRNANLRSGIPVDDNIWTAVKAL